MSVVLAEHFYGKSRIRLTKVTHRADRHELSEWTVDVQLGGDFAAAYTAGDNRLVVPTDTMKNRVYVLASDAEFTSPEAFALRYTGDFLRDYSQVTSATVRVVEQDWQQIPVAGRPHPTAFIATQSGQRFCEVTQVRNVCRVVAGWLDVPILKTTDSAFRDFHRDEYTTLPDTDDRILATMLTAEWVYAPGEHDWKAEHGRISTCLFETFANHKSLGVQQTLFDMGHAALNLVPSVAEITLKMPNRHRLLFNMAPFGRTNPNQIFVTTDEPSGLIAATLKRDT